MKYIFYLGKLPLIMDNSIIENSWFQCCELRVFLFQLVAESLKVLQKMVAPLTFQDQIIEPEFAIALLRVCSYSDFKSYVCGYRTKLLVLSFTVRLNCGHSFSFKQYLPLYFFMSMYHSFGSLISLVFHRFIQYMVCQGFEVLLLI